MNLARHSISASQPLLIYDARFDAECRVFTASTPAGFAVYRTWPLELIRKREVTGGTLSAIVPLHTSNLLFLIGGGRSPRYPPNKVILWDDIQGKEVAELEFKEKVRGLACRRGWFVVALKRRAVVFRLDQTISKFREYDTCENSRGLIALATAPQSTLLCMPGRQTGHVRLVHLPECPSPKPSAPPLSQRHKSTVPALPLSHHTATLIKAHESPLSALCVSLSGRLLATASSRGTLVRVWDAATGKPVKEFRRGSDKADIFGIAFRPDEKELCVWSDKGTIHLFSLLRSSTANRQSVFSPLTPFIPLPKYFESEWSYAQYRIPSQTSHISLSSTSAGSRSPTADVPDEERCVVGWIEVDSESEEAKSPEAFNGFQLVALTYTGGWYRLSTPKVGGSSSTNTSPSSRPSSPNPRPIERLRSSSVASSVLGHGDKSKGKEREGDKEPKESRECILQEFRRYGRWDGWA